jgi:putative flippase GtrA
VNEPELEPDGSGRHETEAERIDRNLDELLQELRVASIGVQVLFGFLLALPFAMRFSLLDDAQRALYLADLLVAALAIALLIGPAAQHRLVFHQHRKKQLLERANRMAIGGFGALGCAITGAVLLVATVVADGVVVVAVVVATALMLVAAWLMPVMVDRHRGEY